MKNDRPDMPNDTIYLQVRGDEWEGFDTITWCNDKLNEDDIEYVRADFIDQQIASTIQQCVLVLEGIRPKPEMMAVDEVGKGYLWGSNKTLDEAITKIKELGEV